MAQSASPEVDLFMSTTRAFLDREASVSRVREIHARGHAFDRDWWRRGTELGWASLLVPDALGGGSVTGDGVSDLAMVAREMGRTAAPGPLIPVSAVLAGLVETTGPATHASLVTDLVGGQTIATWATYEPGQGFYGLTQTCATPTADGFRIDGVKDRVEAAADSDFFLVTAHDGDSLREFMIPADAPGVTVEPQSSVDLVRSFATVRLDGVPVPQSAAVGSAADCDAVIARQSQIAQVLQCAEVVGALDTVFDMTVEWAGQRHSFGRPLASYQALKHRFADMKTQLEACRAITAWAVREVGARSADALVTTSAAKAFVGEYACEIVQECVQLHGGIGVTWEHDLHVFLRRVILHRALYGTPEEHYANVYTHYERAEAA